MGSLTTEKFIEKSKLVHGDKFDYSKSRYINNQTKVCIICKQCGKEFWQIPRKHYGAKHGCPYCNGGVKYTKNTFIEKAKEIHGDKYDYSKVNYKNSLTNVCVICSEHGEFWVTPSNHLRGQGCPKCYNKRRGDRLRKKEEQFNADIKKYSDKYDFSKVKYINNKTKVCITCKQCGNDFWIRPNDFLNGHGCASCKGVKKLTIEDFIRKAQEVHGTKYDYSMVNYKNIMTPVKILCNKHGIFKQTPNEHINGKCGCPKCNESHMEEEIRLILEANNIQYEYRKKDFPWLKNKSNMEIDFYLPNYSIGIECQGIQHFKSKDFFGGDKEFQKQVKRDILKKELCEKNGIKLLYYTNVIDNIPMPYLLYTDKNNIIEEILK